MPSIVSSFFLYFYYLLYFVLFLLPKGDFDAEQHFKAENSTHIFSKLYIGDSSKNSCREYMSLRGKIVGFWVAIYFILVLSWYYFVFPEFDLKTVIISKNIALLSIFYWLAFVLFKAYFVYFDKAPAQWSTHIRVIKQFYKNSSVKEIRDKIKATIPAVGSFTTITFAVMTFLIALTYQYYNPRSQNYNALPAYDKIVFLLVIIFQVISILFFLVSLDAHTSALNPEWEMDELKKIGLRYVLGFYLVGIHCLILSILLVVSTISPFVTVIGTFVMVSIDGMYHFNV